MTPRRSPGVLPTNSYAILGLISFGEMSGYDLKQFADGSIHYFFWSPARSQVYAELRRLTALGYVTEREVEQERRPDKRLYRITPAGKEALQSWLSQPEVAPEVHKSMFLLKLFFGGMTPKQTLIAQLEERRRQAQESLEQFAIIEGEIKGVQDFFFPYLILKAGMANRRAALQWVDDAIEELSKGMPQKPPTASRHRPKE